MVLSLTLPAAARLLGFSSRRFPLFHVPAGRTAVAANTARLYRTVVNAAGTDPAGEAPHRALAAGYRLVR